MATVTQVASPATLAGMDVDSQLILKAIEKKLQLETVLGGIFEDLGAEVVNSGKKMMVPNAIFFKLDAVPQGARQVTIPMIKPLSGAPTVGNSTPVGNEETRSMNYATFYYDEYSHAVAVENWGINYNEMEMYGVFQRAQPDLSRFMKEFREQRIREALLVGADSVLTASTSTAGLTPHFNKNWFVPNIANGSQPSWNATPSTRVDQGGVATASVGQALTFNLTASAEGADGLYSNLSPLTNDGSGTGLIVNITIDGTASVTTVVNPGTGYEVGDILVFAGATLGGVATTNDVTFTVATIDVESEAADYILPGDSIGAAGEVGSGAYFTNAIGQSLISATSADDGAPTTTTVGYAQIDLDYLQALEYYASNYVKIDPIMVDGKETYVVLVPSTQATLLRKNTSGQLGEIWTSMSRASGDEMNYNGFINRVGKLLLIEDQRYPTIQLTGTIDGVDGSATAVVIETQFVKPGDTDNRHKDAHVGTDCSGAAATLTSAHKCNFDIGFLLGKGGICEWEVKGLHFEKELQNYGKNEGVGVFGESGIQLVQYDDASGFAGTNDSRENFGSIVLPFATPAVVTVQ